MKFKIVLEQGEDGYIVASCPALKGCHTQGKTEAEALQNIQEAIELYLEVLEEREIKKYSPNLLREVLV